jgi:hypothetical protein
MRKYKSVISAIVIGLFVTACATALTKDIKVDTESAPNANLGAYKTYAWIAAAQILNDPAGQWEPRKFDADAEIRFLINNELRKKGMSEVDRNPDMLVAYIAGVDMAALELKEDPKQEMEVLKNSPKGALAVMFIDTATIKPIWAGVAVGNVKTERSAEDSKKRLNYAVAEMFKKLPKQ